MGFSQLFLLSMLARTAHTLALEGQRVVVTGGGRGIGRAIALICASEGAKVAILARNSEELAAVVEEGGSSVRAFVADVTDETAVDAAVDMVVADMGGIDVLINNAGGACKKGPTHEQSVADLRQLMNLNVASVAIVSSSVLRKAMLPDKKGGHIINISSRAGKVGLANMGPYVASKFAVEGLTATLAAERPTARDAD